MQVWVGEFDASHHAVVSLSLSSAQGSVTSQLKAVKGLPGWVSTFISLSSSAPRRVFSPYWSLLSLHPGLFQSFALATYSTEAYWSKFLFLWIALIAYWLRNGHFQTIFDFSTWHGPKSVVSWIDADLVLYFTIDPCTILLPVDTEVRVTTLPWKWWDHQLIQLVESYMVDTQEEVSTMQSNLYISITNNAVA